MKITSKLFVILLFMLLMASCTNENRSAEEQVSLSISAAISLTDALTEIITLYEKENPVEITLNLGGSGSLAQQIQQGAPVDLFISANENWMDTLETDGLLLENTRVKVTGNQLVLISNQTDIEAAESLETQLTSSNKQLAIGNPESVPAGAYTKEALQNIGIWDDLQEQIILAKDVRQVLTYVETGNVTYGFVYASDAKNSSDSTILTTIPNDLHEAVTYPGAILEATHYPKEAENFLTFLSSTEAQEIFKKYGFQS